MRFDDTNPEKEEQEYVDGILDAVQWLGFDWEANGTEHLYHASDYFDFMYRAAEYLIDAGLAYVDEQSAEEMRAQPRRLQHARHRQPLPQPHASTRTWRASARCATASSPTARTVLRAKIDMASPNINMRDPALYRISTPTHHNTGDKWCIYPMYTYAHPIEDALENITHSICTLEFEDQRPFYDWLLDRLAEGGLLQAAASAPVRIRAAEPDLRDHQQAQAEAAGRRRHRRRLGRPAHAHHRRPAPPRLHAREPPAVCERIGVTKADSWIDYARSKARCATTSTRRRRARWRCSTR